MDATEPGTFSQVKLPHIFSLLGNLHICRMIRVFSLKLPPEATNAMIDLFPHLRKSIRCILNIKVLPGPVPVSIAAAAAEPLHSGSENTAIMWQVLNSLAQQQQQIMRLSLLNNNI